MRAIAVLGNRVFLGGSFTTIDGQSRARLAQVSGVTGGLVANWAPRANNAVRALALSAAGTRLYAGGGFTAVDGQSRPYLAAVSVTTGALDNTFRPPTPNGRIWDIERVGGRVYTAEGGPYGGRAAAYGPRGARFFSLLTAGDTQAVAVVGDKAYFGGHFERILKEPCEGLIAVDATTGAIDRSWKPVVTPRYLGVWALTADTERSRIYVGGDFTKMSGVTHRYFARFSY